MLFDILMFDSLIILQRILSELPRVGVYGNGRKEWISGIQYLTI